MVTPSDAIAPGSIPYGEREQFAAAVDSAGQAPGAAPAATSGAAGVGGPLDPLRSMLTGGLAPSGDPVTSGLSVGPGASPALTPGQNDPVQQRLLYIATNAKSPKLRTQARAALRGLVLKKRHGVS